MTASSTPTSASIWHVCAGHSGRGGRACERVRAALLAFREPVPTFLDVYRALARLGVERAARPKALVVCADHLGRAELEFFTIVARRHADVRVYVHADERALHRLELALKLGAVEATESTLLALADAETRDAPPIHRLSVPPPRNPDRAKGVLDQPGGRDCAATDGSATADASSPGPGERAAALDATALNSAPSTESMRAAAGIDAPAGGDRPLDRAAPRESGSTTRAGESALPPPLRLVAAPEEAEYATVDAAEATVAEAPSRGGEEESVLPARVPWLRYDDRPIRLPPKRRTPSTEDSPHSEPVSTNGAPAARAAGELAPSSQSTGSLSDLRFEPLLTEEELQALLGDEWSDLDTRTVDRETGSASP